MDLRVLRCVALVPATLFAGCGGCSFPFERTPEGSTVFGLGELTDDCSGEGDTTDAETGAVAHWVHANDGTTCTLSSHWEGTLLDTSTLADDIEDEVQKQGLDPSTVSVQLDSLTVQNVHVSLLHDGGALSNPPIVSYEGNVDVEAQADLIVVSGSDLENPDVTTAPESDAFAQAATDAVLAREPIAGSGDATLVLNMADLGTYVGLENPRVAIDYEVKVNGLLIIGQ